MNKKESIICLNLNLVFTFMAQIKKLIHFAKRLITYTYHPYISFHQNKDK